MSKYAQISTPWKTLLNLYNQRQLIKQFVIREISSRYKGSYLGLFWTLLNPLFMLAVYTFVFSIVFNSRWGVSGSKVEFALILFSGITTFNLFAEVITSSPSIIINNANYVKKVVFPLEILPVVVLGASAVHMFISIIILILGLICLLGVFHWTIFFVPIVLLPLLLLSLGLSFFLTSLGVYLRDIGHIVGVAVQALMFLSPIFYPVSAIPASLRIIYYINPISYVVEDMRRIMIWGQLPHWDWLLIGTFIGGVTFWLGHFWFQKTRGGFADVL
jgi:lipopolysaccharide transport system permease protein